MNNNNYISVKEFRKDPKKFTQQQINYMCGHQNLSKKFMREMADYLNWENISLYQKLDDNFIDEMEKYIDWNCIWHYQALSEDFIEKHMYDRERYKFSWDKINYNWRISYHKPFVFKHWYEMNVLGLSSYIFGMDDEMWRLIINDDRWKNEKFAISINIYGVSLDFIREFQDKLDLNQRLAYRFEYVEKFWDEFGEVISKKNFEYYSSSYKQHKFKTVKKYQDKINWSRISPEKCGDTEEEIEEIRQIQKIHTTKKK